MGTMSDNMKGLPSQDVPWEILLHINFSYFGRYNCLVEVIGVEINPNGER